MAANELEAVFPGLRGSEYEIHSPKDRSYNCIAWACGDDSLYWWPRGFYWPPDAPRRETVEGFAEMVRVLGFDDADDERLMEGVEKVALFALDGEPKHMARQLRNGRWTSKLGAHVDIEHDLRAIEGDCYGRVVRIFQRERE